MKPWNKIKWQKANAELANKPFADLFRYRYEKWCRFCKEKTTQKRIHECTYGLDVYQCQKCYSRVHSSEAHKRGLRIFVERSAAMASGAVVEGEGK